VGRTAVAPETLSFAEARARVLAAAAPLAPETVTLGEARGRALRRAVSASHDLPPFRNSSMDGVAVRADAIESPPVDLPVVAVVAAGAVPPRALGPGEAMRIMTGAMLPEGADAVVPVEDLSPAPGGGDRVRIARRVAPGENVREAGADIAAGSPALAEGREISAHDVGLLAALGEARVTVGRRPTVAVLSTGDELLGVTDPLRPGAVRDSNLPMLSALLEESGARGARAVRLPDDPARVAAEIGKTLEIADVVVTIGGVSAGDFDPVKQALAIVGDIALWRVAMKPGRPQAFGRPRGRLFFGLPGNPASVACVFEALVRPALRRLQGFADVDRPRVTARAAEAVESRPGRTDFVRVTLEPADGGWRARPAGAQVSGHVTPQSRAHALLVVPEGTARLEPGDAAEAWLLRWPDPS
jgi:molybdopterin molybdotransferase